MEPEVQQRFERIEAILEAVSRSHAAASARMDKHDARMDKHEARMDKHEARMDKLEARFEKRMKGFEKLAQIGMKEIGQLRRAQRQTDEKINALIDAQQRTEAMQRRTEASQLKTDESLRLLLDSLRKGSNGRKT